MDRRQHHSHVPKFGNWDSDNVPYSAYFENARKEKSGTIMNPNDPMENPEAFNTCMRVDQNVDADEVKAYHTNSHNESSILKGSHEVMGNHTRRYSHHRRSRESLGSFTAEFSHSDYSVIGIGPQSDYKRNMSKGGSGINSFSSSSHNRHRSGSHSFNDHANHQATAIPKFGTWDVTDPKSGEGYTAIFSKIKEEKQIASTSISTPPLDNYSNVKTRSDGPYSRLSKSSGICFIYHCCSCFLFAMTNQNPLLEFLTNHSHLFFLHPNESPSQVLVTPLHNGNNYHVWDRAMTMTLRSKNKLGYINGNLAPPPEEDPMFEAWDRCNTMVGRWIH
ncbi:uncharacterized protein LOC133287236 [Gastrolobium bilobum]|uniref:uncharacterized protein LOC133287236 n=1 Tax=Gastrolobium bilobum TaxID=150636 RepID=UPI002AB1B60C|nr:uncharacterized protein LOC133287236 [Gastrolobium bilobum]